MTNTLPNSSPDSVCERFKLEPLPPAFNSKLGLALTTLGAVPIHGLRVPPTSTTNGWYLWCGGEMSLEPGFFSPLHVEHIGRYLPEVMGYLDIPPGWRFLIDAKGYENVWFDERLLEDGPLG